MSGIDKKINFLNKNKNKRERKYPLIKTRLIELVCLFSVSRYNSWFLESYLSNLLADQIKSFVALRILELSLRLSDIFPKSKICVKALLVFSNKL